jgi:NNP family nitrate/nitrite transporter-like MFS transporter
MEISNKATRINLFSLSTRPMRAFHMTWFSFFLCFFAWFGIAPLMAIDREELGLTKTQIGNTIIASVAITIIARFVIGWACDRIGPRLCYTWLLTLASLPVMGIGLAHSYESFLLFRLGIGVIGASFVITQYHTSVMFAPNCVGAANATSAGWGNLGGGVTQMIMPLVFAAFVALGYSDYWSWRLSMVAAGGVCFITGVAYYFVTTDFPDGNLKDLRERGEIRAASEVRGTFWLAAKDYRVIFLFFIYAACFGVELTINNIAALYFMDYFGLGLKTAGLVAGLFGLMNIFARTTGGLIGDIFGHHQGLAGRAKWLFIALFVEGIALMVFSQMKVLPVAIGFMIVFSLFTQMSEGATYSVVPFINKRALGSVAGIVGAGGNMGAVAAGFLFRVETLTWPIALLILGAVVSVTSFLALGVRFSATDEAEIAEEHDAAVEARRAAAGEKPSLDIPELAPQLLRKLQPIDLLRIYLGIALMIKGIYFITHMEEVDIALLDSTGGATILIAWYVAFVHGVGGACLALGFMTRLAAALNMTVLLGAIMFVHSSEGLFASSHGLQFSVLVLFTLALLLWRGSGTFSIDQLVKNMELTPRSA